MDFKKNQDTILAQLDFPNVFTIGGLMLSLFSVICSIQNNFYAAIICMIFSGMVDLFDGVIARRLERTPLQAEVGKQLDSLVDACSFGFSPVVFAYCFGLQDPYSVGLLAFYAAMATLRLAYFNSTGLSASGEKSFFTGLPVIYAALFVPVGFLSQFFLADTAVQWLLRGIYLLLAIAMVSPIQVIKIKGAWYGVFAAGAVLLASAYGWAIFQSMH
ncbi:MAG: CDP-alcohol phosphatidyltransferase family protein [Cyanobacteria bacterium P01_D01_bin.105]